MSGGKSVPSLPKRPNHLLHASMGAPVWKYGSRQWRTTAHSAKRQVSRRLSESSAPESRRLHCPSKTYQFINTWAALWRRAMSESSQLGPRTPCSIAKQKRIQGTLGAQTDSRMAKMVFSTGMRTMALLSSAATRGIVWAKTPTKRPMSAERRSGGEARRRPKIRCGAVAWNRRKSLGTHWSSKPMPELLSCPASDASGGM
mmetsp:Transcript_45219/g.131588  ORF Transcript_45219/g.131588 Transcript_45219/m.131588 type:complete len:201 (+) Transcript_45219:221-823(+)